MAIITNVNINAGVSNGGATPDWCPPGIIYKDADEIYVPKGRYYKAGHRFNSQYQDLSNMADYWDVAAQFAVDIDAAYSAGSTSGMVGGKVNSSWYSVFMVGSDELVVLPYIRVDTISYSSPSTTIAPAAHADGTTAENGFVTSNDQFNGYRLVLINDDPTESGNIYTIADCATGTPDSIVIIGDVTGTIAATEWLQMIPAEGTPFVYLGVIRTHSDGTLRWFKKDKWYYQLPDRVSINGTANTTAANSDLGAAVPPSATYFYAGVKTACNNTTGLTANMYRGSDGTSICEQIMPFYLLPSAGNIQSTISSRIPLSAPALIRNNFTGYVSGTWVNPNEAVFLVTAFEE